MLSPTLILRSWQLHGWVAVVLLLVCCLLFTCYVFVLGGCDICLVLGMESLHAVMVSIITRIGRGRPIIDLVLASVICW